MARLTMAESWEFTFEGMKEHYQRGLQSPNPSVRKRWQAKLDKTRDDYYLGAFAVLKCLERGAERNALVDEINQWRENFLAQHLGGGVKIQLFTSDDGVGRIILK